MARPFRRRSSPSGTGRPRAHRRFRRHHPDVAIADDLEQAVRAADIITSATMSTEPIIKGAWLQPGQHIDLIGAYRPDMREVDDAALQTRPDLCG